MQYILLAFGGVVYAKQDQACQAPLSHVLDGSLVVLTVGGLAETEDSHSLYLRIRSQT